MSSCIVYIGDFDFRNENVQAHLVKNNGKILTALGYHVEYIGINRKESSFEAISKLPLLQLENGNCYYELPETLNIKGLFKTLEVCQAIINKLDELQKQYDISHIITYQSPTYSIAIKKITKWCQEHKVHYIVNCADLPTFELQSPLRKIVMKANWNYLHKVNKKYADGVIAVSKFIAEFYDKPGRASVVIPPLFDVVENITHVKPNDTATFIYAGTPFKITGREASPDGMKDRLDKVIDYFLLLSEQGKKYTLNIVGINKNDYLNGVPRHATALGNESNIVFWGKHSHEDTLRMVSESDFSINYRDENLMTKAGFSTKIVESVSLGTPVIINEISDTFDYLMDGISGFVMSTDVESLKMLSSLCEMKVDERIEIKKKCLKTKTFHWQNYEDCFAKFLENVQKQMIDDMD